MRRLYTLLFHSYLFRIKKVTPKTLRFDKKIVGEISSLGSVTLTRQSAVSILSMVLNNSLVSYGGVIYLGVYGIINRVLMFANFPVLGITQGFVPIAGFNFEQKVGKNTRLGSNLLIKSATLIALLVLCFSYDLCLPYCRFVYQ